MQVSEIDNVKIYNLSAGKSLPDWLSERKKRAILKKNVDLRRRIELIQEFDMPGVSTSIRASADGQYIMATGIYKPRIKCYDVNNLSLKFERCLDSEVVTFEILSEDYTKIVFLQCDRYVEFHVGHGRHYRLRVPHFGRDIAYHKPSCDLFVVGASNEVYRLNLEVGQFMAPYATKANEINTCAVNEEHGLLVIGTDSGQVEAWDPRTKSCQGLLDCALHCSDAANTLPAITKLKFSGALQLGVGSSSGHVLLYDIRSSKPLLVKDHMNEIPIKNIEFHKQMNYVYSMDSLVLKIWDANTGKQYTNIEASADFNDLCIIPNTGLCMMAVEDPKMQIYYVPSLGPAPKWCSFLDNLTEELESSAVQTVYDDYKFITKQELESLGLDHLLGTNLLRAYMHGYFVDARLYKRAKTIADPFAFEAYKKRKIREKIEEERPARLTVHDSLPAVNRDLASRLQNVTKKNKQSNNLLKDDRFKELFENPDFEVDKEADEYRLLNPVLSRLDRKNTKNVKQVMDVEVETVEEEKDSDIELYESSEESSDDERTWAKDMKKQHKLIRNKKQEEERDEERNEKVYEFSNAPKLTNIRSITRVSKSSLGDRLSKEGFTTMVTGTGGNKEMKFSMRGKKNVSDNQKSMKKHYEERKQLVRRTGFLSKKKLPRKSSDLLDSHVLDNEKLRCAPAMETSRRSSLGANSVEIGEITESPDTEYMSTSAILHYCKSKILVPYLKLLTIMGLRPVVDASNSSKYAICFSHYHSAQVAVLMFLGYILQYMACFRRDRGFCYKLVPLAMTSSLEYDTYKQICYGNVTLTYIGPSILHFIGFLYALYLFRISDNEQLQNLMERVFLLSSYAPQGSATANPKRLLRMLWFFIILSIIWMCISLCSVNLMLARGTIMFRWMENSSNEMRLALKVLLIICTLIHDMVQATVITSYCLQAQLLQAHLLFLRERLLNRTITPLNWMREIAEFRKLLKYLNDELAPAVCLFTIVNVSWAASGLMWLLDLDKVDTETEPIAGISILNQSLWLAAVIAPFVQAARLSYECRRTQSVGHELCVRPFLHQDTPHEEISAVLLYAATLQLRAKLFCHPVAGKYVCLALTLALVALFALGMCHYLQ
ncbi:PREDICTED: nucleolar protein 10 [Papilio polytes]|uniref:nucleolar protein 10 n=1 Tax=Papilio polytes TaxID=76194 RepID=UPI0006769BBB|nr:PREDICTED: nucleolar protein 10 [Papilio polytes]